MVDTALKTQEQTKTKHDSLTEKGAPTHSTSLNSNVDLFFTIGASRGKDIGTQFEAALSENPEVAVRILLWARDVRGGAGERQTFKNLMATALNSFANDEARINNFMNKVVEVGRWDDLIALFFDTKFEYYALCKIRDGLQVEQNGLAAKWLPRPKKSAAANKIRKFLGLSPKGYRKMLTTLSDTVEQKMCSKEWGQIDYEKVPSLAQARYSNAFRRNDEARYTEYLESLEKGEAKVNAAAVYPYDVVKTMLKGSTSLANSQWNALPNYCEGNEGDILPLVDVSGSMGCTVGGNQNLTCMDVAISLGLYLSERLEGQFKNHFMTFSSEPQLQMVNGNLESRYEMMRRSKWGMSTDISKAFNVLLTTAKTYGAPESMMPQTILILSDMEFDPASNSSYGPMVGYAPSTMDDLRRQYEEAGYKLPNIVWWNLNARTGNVPVRFDEEGTALVSGFSPSIMKSLLGGENMTPQRIMLDTIMVDRYEV